MSVITIQEEVVVTVREDVVHVVTVQVQGPPGPPGDHGLDGWSPLFAIVADGDRRVLQVADWVGGDEPKPTTGQYVGAAGLTANIAEAVDIRGTPADTSSFAALAAANLFQPANTLILPIDILGISGLTQPLFRIRNDVGIVVLRCNNGSGSVEVNRINATSGRWDFLSDGQLLLAAEGHVMFSNGTAIAGPWTVGIRRSAQGVIDITNGTTSGALGRLRSLGYFVRSGAADPTTSDLADGYFCVWRNTTTGDVKLWANIGGTLLSTGALT